MIVDQLNTLLHGGAAIAARRLHESLRKSGVESRFWFSTRARRQPPGPDFRLLDWNAQAGIAAKWLAKARRLGIKFELKRSFRGRPISVDRFSHARNGSRTPYATSPLEGDVLHLHWVSDFIDYPSFFESIAGSVPVVWTLHDMNAFTGGCHHSDDCEAYLTGCGSCPQLGSSGPGDLSARVFRIKRVAYRDQPFHVVTPSRWLENKVRGSTLLGEATSIQTIHNGLDVDLFSPRDRLAARRKLGIPEDCFVIGCGAVSLAERRKGFQELLEVLSRITDPTGYRLLAIGDGQFPDNCRIPQVTTGYLWHASELADFYSAVDVFVMTSLAETMPQMVVEAMACGVPIVGFSVGGVPEIVRPDETGLLAPFGDCDALAAHLEVIRNNNEARKSMGRRARELAVAEFDERNQTKLYVELYQAAIAERSAASRSHSRHAYAFGAES